MFENSCLITARPDGTVGLRCMYSQTHAPARPNPQPFQENGPRPRCCFQVQAFLDVQLQGGQTLRYSALRKRIDGVSERMLAQTLKSLEENNFLIRASFNVVPPHVEYTLTNFGEGAAERVLALAQYLETSVAERTACLKMD